MRIGLLTSGGDCPGLNAVIRGAALKSSLVPGNEFVGFTYGWRGVVNADLMHLDRHSVRGLSKQGGTILGSSRTNPFEGPCGGLENISRMVKEKPYRLGPRSRWRGTLTAARRLSEAGLPVVGVPKTIDNDLAATDYSFGFDTAVEIATEAVDRIRTTGNLTSAASLSKSWAATLAGSRFIPAWLPVHTPSSFPSSPARSLGYASGSIPSGTGESSRYRYRGRICARRHDRSPLPRGTRCI